MENGPENILEVKNLTVAFQGNVVLQNINFKLGRGEMLGVIGPNGAGKTVLSKALLGLIDHLGTIEWAPHIKVGYVPQNFHIMPNMPLTVGEFLKLQTKNTADIHNALQHVGWNFEDQSFAPHSHNRFLNQQLEKLSGGQLQRVLLAWALLAKAEVLLLDEPTSGVDVGVEESIYATLAHLRDERGITIIFISHELNIVSKYATKVLCLNKSGLCFGAPSDALEEGKLSQLYGENIKFYTHHH